MKFFILFFSESVSYQFGPQPGLITFSYPEGKYLDRRVDTLALGFKTTESDAVLVRVDSATTEDYMELELVCVSLTVLSSSHSVNREEAIS